MFKAFTVAAAITLTPAMAFADTIILEKPMQGASLHEGAIDMVVYYLDHEDHYEVVATYLAKTDGEPQRLRMGLKDGDSANFRLPGQRHVAYAFSRENDAVHVSAELAGQKTAELLER